MNTKNYRVYVDLEYCYPGMTRASGRPSETDRRQIIQIGAILFDTVRGQEVDSLNILTWPAFEKQLPTFFTELTDITQDMLEKQATTFPEAFKAFKAFIAAYPVWTFNADWRVFKQNCEYFSTECTFEVEPFVRVKPMLATWGVDSNEYSSGTLYKAAGLSMFGHVHDALHDVRSMAAAVHYFENRNQSA